MYIMHTENKPEWCLDWGKQSGVKVLLPTVLKCKIYSTTSAAICKM
jgi:hypothetical protein